MIVKEILFIRMNMIPKNEILSFFLMMNNICCINFNAGKFLNSHHVKDKRKERERREFVNIY